MLRAATIALLLVTAQFACVRRGPALPQPRDVVEFAIPWERSYPSDVVLDDRGRLWFTDRVARVIGRFDPGTREFDRFELPTPKSAPYGFVRGPDGAFWYTAAMPGRLGRIDPETGEITEVDLKGVIGGPNLLAATGTELWFTARSAQMYGRYEPMTGRLEVYTTPKWFRPYGIAVVNGRVWIIEDGGSALLEVDGETEQARVHELSRLLSADDVESTTASAEPLQSEARPVQPFHLGARRIAASPDGVLWISGYGSSRVVSFDPVSGELDDYPALSTPSKPYGITVAADGLVWYGERGNNAVIALDPRRRDHASFRIPTPGAVVRDLAVDIDRGRVWLPLSEVGKIGLIELGARE